MDIEQHKQNIAGDPQAELDPAVPANERAELEAFRNEMLALDETIGKALNIEVPELRMPELPALEDAPNVVSMPVRSKRSFAVPMWLGLAASVALVAVLGGQWFTFGNGAQQALAEELIAHLEHEPWALQSSSAVSETRLRNVVTKSGAAVDSELGVVTYARTCIINGNPVPHLVIQGETGPVTLLLLPDESVNKAVPLSGESVNGVILPVGEGSIAIIGERDENLSNIERQVVDSVTWDI